MAAIFLLMKNKQQKQILAASNKKKGDAAFAKDILKRFAKSHPGTLKFDEVRMWLQTVVRSQGVYSDNAVYEMDKLLPGSAYGVQALSSDPVVGSVRGGGHAPNVEDEEVEWVIMMAMEKRQAGSFKKLVLDTGTNLKDVQLQPTEFEAALNIWISYSLHRPVLDAAMKKYGSNLEGQMEREHVKSMLTDMNNGTEPDEGDVNWVLDETMSMRKPGGITKPQLLKVLSLWYIKQQEKALAREQSKPKSRLCIIS